MKSRLICLLFLAALLLACEDATRVDSISLSQNTLSLRIAESVQLEVILSPLASSSYNTVTWTSSDPSVATVDARGLITAVYVGECTVTASAGGRTASCVVTVGTTRISPIFTRAIAVGGTDDNASGANHITLFLLDSASAFDTVTMRPAASASYLLLDIESPWDDTGVAAGDYAVSEIPQPYSCMPGSLLRNGEISLLTGSYMVIPGDTLLIGRGSFSVSSPDSGAVSGSFDCDGYEILSFAYSGGITYYDTGENGGTVERFVYDRIQQEQNGKTPDSRYYMTALTLTASSSRSIRVNLVSPLSSPGYIAPGQYSITGSAAPFCILSCASLADNCPVYVNSAGEERLLVSGSLTVAYRDGEPLCSGIFHDADGAVIICSPE